MANSPCAFARTKVSMPTGLLFVVLAFLLPDFSVAQPFSPRLPTLQGGDYGNGAATSHVAGGAFLRETVAPAPAAAYGIPTPFGPGTGSLFAGAGVQNGLRGDRDFTDGAAFLGTGLGSASRFVGLELTLAAYDLVGDTGKDGSVSWKLHRRLGPVALGIGVENAWIFGTTDGGRSRYASAGTVLPLRSEKAWLSEAVLIGGVGDGRFTRWRNVEAGRSRGSLFGSLSLRVHRRVGVFGTWTGQNLNGGVSIAPFRRIALVVTPVLLDLAGRHTLDRRPRLALGGGIAVPVR
jgi:hypothetical protein